MRDDEHFKRILVEDKFPATDEITGDALSAEERDGYLSIINRFPFIVNGGFTIVQMCLHKYEDLVLFNGSIGRNDGVVGTIDGRIDLVFERVRMDISLSDGKKYDWVIANYEDLINEKKR